MNGQDVTSRCKGPAKVEADYQIIRGSAPTTTYDYGIDGVYEKYQVYPQCYPSHNYVTFLDNHIAPSLENRLVVMVSTSVLC